MGPVSWKSRNFFGTVSGDIILFVSPRQTRLEAWNFAVIFILIPFTTCEKISFTEQPGRNFTNGFSDPKSSRDFRETGPRQEETKFNDWRTNQSSRSLYCKSRGFTIRHDKLGERPLFSDLFPSFQLFTYFNVNLRVKNDKATLTAVLWVLSGGS